MNFVNVLLLSDGSGTQRVFVFVEWRSCVNWWHRLWHSMFGSALAAVSDQYFYRQITTTNICSRRLTDAAELSFNLWNKLTACVALNSDSVVCGSDLFKAPNWQLRISKYTRCTWRHSAVDQLCFITQVCCGCFSDAPRGPWTQHSVITWLRVCPVIGCRSAARCGPQRDSATSSAALRAPSPRRRPAFTRWRAHSCC